MSPNAPLGSNLYHTSAICMHFLMVTKDLAEDILLSFVILPKQNLEHISDHPLIRPPFGNTKSGLIKGVTSHEGYIKYIEYTLCSLKVWPHKKDGLWRG